MTETIVMASQLLSDRDIMSRVIDRYVETHPNTVVTRQGFNTLARNALDAQGRVSVSYNRTVSDILSEMVARGTIQRLQQGRYYMRQRNREDDPAAADLVVSVDLKGIMETAGRLAADTKLLLQQLSILKSEE